MGAVWFGNDIPDDTDLRLVGDVKGKRVLELGLPPAQPNSIVMAQAGARVLAVDSSAAAACASRLQSSRSRVQTMRRMPVQAGEVASA